MRLCSDREWKEAGRAVRVRAGNLEFTPPFISNRERAAISRGLGSAYNDSKRNETKRTMKPGKEAVGGEGEGGGRVEEGKERKGRMRERKEKEIRELYLREVAEGRAASECCCHSNA